MTHPDGRVALVTGGAQGIGRSIALRLARDGADIAILDIDATGAEATAAAIRTLGRHALALGGDVAAPAEVTAAVEAVERELGPIAILVNNAGICRIGPALETPLADLQAMLRVNVEGTFICCQAVVPRMVARRAGVVVNLSSWAGKSGRPWFGAYSASKFAVTGFTQALAAEVAPHGVRVNAVCPGIVVATNMRTEIEAAQQRWGLPETREREKAIPLGRVSVPEDVARVVAFLVSEDAAYVAGEAINVTGGLWMD